MWTICTAAARVLVMATDHTPSWQGPSQPQAPMPQLPAEFARPHRVTDADAATLYADEIILAGQRARIAARMEGLESPSEDWPRGAL